ncbi:MAG: TerB family tellurite resistance protein [Rhodoferax sp.]|jgi:uncharacterized tellurite resistance protein B-like protein|nr:TerB family tellurite resistance protein [Rhodoferax sp.]
MSKHFSSAHRYPRNSPHAAGRVVALALIANGEVKPSEWAELETHQVHEQLGLTKEEWHDVVGDLYVDVVCAASSLAGGLVDQQVIAQVLADVDDPALQRRVIGLCMAVIHADRQIDEGESAVLRTAIDRWDLHPEDQEVIEPLLYGRDFQVMPRRTRWH